jgi:NhaA family Na+:H+ antiporter
MRWVAAAPPHHLSGIPDIYEEDDPAYHLRMAAIHERKAAEHRRIAQEKTAERHGVAEVAGGAGEESDGPA